MIIGILAALGSAGIYPLMFLAYGKVASTLVDLDKNKILNDTSHFNLNETSKS